MANGHVYVASDKELDIFGFVPQQTDPPQPSIGFVSGVITAVSGSQITVKTNSGAETRVEAQAAIKNGLSTEFYVGKGINAIGEVDEQGPLHADAIKPIRGKEPWRVVA